NSPHGKDVGCDVGKILIFRFFFLGAASSSTALGSSSSGAGTARLAGLALLCLAVASATSLPALPALPAPAPLDLGLAEATSPSTAGVFPFRRPFFSRSCESTTSTSLSSRAFLFPFA